MGAASILRRGVLGLQRLLQQRILPGNFALCVGQFQHSTLESQGVSSFQILPRPIVQVGDAVAQCCRAVQQPVDVFGWRVFHVKHPILSRASWLAILCRISSYSKFDGWIG